MANTKYVLEMIKIEGEMKELLVKTNAENVSVSYKGEDTTLAAALADIYLSLTQLPTDTATDAKIKAAIDELVNGAPEAYDTLKELADYIDEHKEAADALNAAIGNKVDKVEGKGLSTEDFTTALKAKLDALPESLTEATAEVSGLMSAEDKKRLDGVGGVWYGTQPPSGMRDGDLFVRVVSETGDGE